MKRLLFFIMTAIITTAAASAQDCCKQKECGKQSKMLFLVDVQYDFINGSLAVNGAPEVMDSLARFIAAQPAGTYKEIVMTADFHPYNHSSFKDNGGMWPVHCVQFSHGASIYQPVFEAVNKQKTCAPVLTKGDDVAVDEYSIMANKKSAERLLSIIESSNVDEIYVAGLCGDYCVGNTINDLVAAGHGKKIRVMTRFIGNIDDGTVLRGIIKKNNLKEF